MKKCFGRIVCVLAMLLVMGMTVCAADAGNIKKNAVLQTNSEVELHEEPDAASAVTATLPGGTPVIIKEDAKDGWCLVSYKENAGYVQISFLGTLGSPVAAANQSATDDSQSATADSQNMTDDSQNEADDSQNEADVTDDSQNEADVTDDTQNVTGDETEQNQETVTAQDESAVSEDNNALENEFKRIEEAGILAYEEAETTKNQAASERTWGIVIAVLVIAIFAVGITTTVINNKGKKK